MSLFGNSLWQLVAQSDGMTLCVLISLLLMSIACWTVVLYKMLMIRIKRRQLRAAIAHINNAHSVEDIVYAASKFSDTLPGYFLAKSLALLKSLLATDHGAKEHLDDREWELLRDRTEQILEKIAYKEESYLGILSTSAAVAPLLGLFGTVWGLIHAFIDISKKQTADISVVAPGIAEALVTTLVGLIVAIPAAVMFYYLSQQIRDIEHQVIGLADRYIWLVQRLFGHDEQEV